MEKRVGIVGIGTMGLPMVKKFLSHNYRVAVYDVNSSAVTAVEEEGAIGVSSPGDLVKESETILLILPGKREIKSALWGDGGIFKGDISGVTIVDMSTTDPDSTRENGEAAAERGGFYLDAPILGRPHRCGLWTLPVGGSHEAVSKVEPLLSVIAQKVIPVGPPGSGNILKILNNMMLGGINAITVEAMALAEEAGFSQKTFFEVVAESGAASVSGMFLELAPKIVEREFTPNFTVDLLYKDVSLALAMAEKSGTPLPVLEVCQKMNEKARKVGIGSEDTSAVIKMYERHRKEPLTTESID